jgi:hypothetical protein
MLRLQFFTKENETFDNVRRPEYLFISLREALCRLQKSIRTQEKNVNAGRVLFSLLLFPQLYRALNNSDK